MLQKFLNNELIGIVRVHIILPFGKKFKPGIFLIQDKIEYYENISIKKIKDFEVIVINLDLSNIEKSNLFSNKLCETLKKKA